MIGALRVNYLPADNLKLQTVWTQIGLNIMSVNM